MREVSGRLISVRPDREGGQLQTPSLRVSRLPPHGRALTLHRIQNDDLSSRLLAQVINELADLFGDLFFGEFLSMRSRACSNVEPTRRGCVAVDRFLVPVRNFWRSPTQRESKIQISFDGDAVAQNCIELLARQPTRAMRSSSARANKLRSSSRRC